MTCFSFNNCPKHESVQTKKHSIDISADNYKTKKKSSQDWDSFTVKKYWWDKKVTKNEVDVSSCQWKNELNAFTWILPVFNPLTVKKKKIYEWPRVALTKYSNREYVAIIM